MRNMKLTAVLLSALLAVGTYTRAFALSPDEARAVYLRLAKKFPQRKIFYRWQSRTSGLNLVRAQTYSGKIYDYFMKMPFNSYTMHGGRGIYVAETLYTSSRFIRGSTEGSIIEIAVEAGTPFIDLEDPETLEKLKAAGLTGNSKELGELEPNLIVRYRQADVNSRMKDWWVIKSPRGVKVQSFNPNRFTLDELRDISSKMELYGDREDVRLARQVLISRLTDEQRAKLGWKKTYFYDVKDVLAKAVAPITDGRVLTPEDRRFFNEFLERVDEGAKTYAALNIEGSRILEHPEWTDEKLKKFLGALFGQDVNSRPDWVRSWLKVFTKNRAKLLPVFKSDPELGRKMVEYLYAASARYTSERDRAFSVYAKESGPQTLEDLIDVYLAPRSIEGKNFVGLVHTFKKGLGEADYRALAQTTLEKFASRYKFTDEERKAIWPIASQGAADPRRFDEFFKRVKEALDWDRFDRTEQRAAWINEFFDLGPTGTELRKFENQVNMRVFAAEFRQAAYARARTAAEFIDFTGSAFIPGRAEYLEILDQKVAENIEAFVRLRPTEEEMVALMLKLNRKGEASYSKVAGLLVKMSRQPETFARRIDYAACLALLRAVY